MSRFGQILNIFNPFQKLDNESYKDKVDNNLQSIASPSNNDGATEIYNDTTSQYGVTPFGYDIDGDFRNTAQLINTYRGLMQNYEVFNAVRSIVTDAIVFEADNPTVKINLDRTNFSDSIQKKIAEELEIVLSILNFDNRGSDYFRRWYVDSRLVFHKVINPKNPKKGIQEMRRLDPREIKYIRELDTEDQNGVSIIKAFREFFLYNTGNSNYVSGGFVYQPNSRLKIPRSAITYAPSGLVDCEGRTIGYLHQAVKPANQLKLLEDAMVIYRITRAPDRRVFYIDTGNLQNRKAQQMMQGIMTGMRNKVVYDASTGKVKNQQHTMSMTEDYWLQRRDGKAVTEVQNLPGATGMNEMDDVRYFREALYMALQVPLSRIPDSQNGQSNIFDSSSSIISRDEMDFAKIIEDLLKSFSTIILDPLKTNLILKKIISEEEWEENINNIKLIFNKDSYYEELKEADILSRRLELLDSATPYVGVYMSHETVMKKVLQMSDAEIEAEGKLIKSEKNDPRFKDYQENLEGEL